MPPKRKRASSSKNEDAQFIATTNDNNNNNNNNNNSFELRMEELLNSISREVSDLKNENKTIKETVFEMKNEMFKTIKESIFEMKNEMKNEIKGQNDEMKHEIGEMKDTIDEIKCTIDKEFNPTPLWKLVTEWKDVFEEEVLTKLNGTEQKLFVINSS